MRILLCKCTDYITVMKLTNVQDLKFKFEVQTAHAVNILCIVFYMNGEKLSLL